MNLQTLISDEVQLGLALTAFSNAHSLEKDWPIKYTIYLRNAGITSMAYLQQGCVQKTINLDLELFDIPSTELFTDDIIAKLASFLPGPVGFRCFRLAQKAAEKVAYGTAQTEYVNRPANGKKGDEKWTIGHNQNWTLNVDCAGFVRNCLKHVTKNPFRILLSDRDFMRAKDFYGFFSSLPYTVLDTQDNSSDEAASTNGTTNGHHHQHPLLHNNPNNTDGPNTMSWRRVPDLRMVIPGDVIVYRPKGNAAGGAAFTEYDRKDLSKLCKAVKAAQLYRIIKQEWDTNHSLVEPQNVMKDPSVQPWAKAVEDKLNAVGIMTVKHLLIALDGLKKFKYTPYGVLQPEPQKYMGDFLNQHLKAAGYTTLKIDTINLMYECATTTAMNTGHIVFAAGIAVDMGLNNNEYRIRVVHSTKFGKKDVNGVVTTGVQEHYRRFKLIQEKGINPITGQEEIVREFWTRTPREVSNTTTATNINNVTNQQIQPQPMADLLMNATRSDCGDSVNGIQSLASMVSYKGDNTGATDPTTTANTPLEISINPNVLHCGGMSDDDMEDVNDDMEEEPDMFDSGGTKMSTATSVSTNTKDDETNGTEAISSPTTTAAVADKEGTLKSMTNNQEQRQLPNIKDMTLDTEDADDVPNQSRMKPTDELSGQSEIVVVAARMCF